MATAKQSFRIYGFKAILAYAETRIHMEVMCLEACPSEPDAEMCDLD